MLKNETDNIQKTGPSLNKSDPNSPIQADDDD